MSLRTISKFYYGFTITADNNKISFNEGAAELIATLSIGSYTLTDIVAEVKRAMDIAGALTYTVSVNRSTRIITIAAGSTFALLTTSGSTVTVSAFGVIGFSGADKTGASTYSGGTAVGTSYTPQFKLQDFISSDDWQEAVDAVINKSASGTNLEVVKFGDQSFTQFSIKWITDLAQRTGSPITNDPSARANVRAFLNHLISKAPFEFMPDAALPTTFQKLIFESSPDSQTGIGYKLKEKTDSRLSDYFDTPILKMRVLE